MHAQENYLRVQVKSMGMVREVQQSSRVVTDGGFHRCAVDHSVFYRKTSGDCVALVVYVDDILLTGCDAATISDIKEYLRRYFVSKDIGKSKYFLDIEFVYSKGRMCLLQRKYTLDLL